VTGRASVFSDPRIISIINQHFVPVADDCGPLQTGRDEVSRFFQLIAEQGHYAGRVLPTRTRQGLYVATPEGKLLASVNSTSADRVLNMIERAITAWKSEPSNTGGADEVDRAASKAVTHASYPEGGLVLKMYVRDLPRENSNGRNSRLNFDHVWITKDEVKQFVPASVRIGDRLPVATNIIARLARSHLVDTVRGQCPAWDPTHLQKGDIQLVVESIEDHRVQLRLEGHIRLAAQPDHEVNPYSRRAVDKERGIDARLLGYLSYNREKEAFEKFRMIAVGPRWGAYVYNGRNNDPGPAPIGFAFEIAQTDTVTDRTPPMALRSDYFNK
jgi:hypothetical protein